MRAVGVLQMLGAGNDCLQALKGAVMAVQGAYMILLEIDQDIDKTNCHIFHPNKR